VILPADSASFILHGWSSTQEAVNYVYYSRVSVLDGLTPGGVYYARVMQAVQPPGGNTDIGVRDLLVAPLPAGAVYDHDDTLFANITSATFITGSPVCGETFVAPPSGKALVAVGGGGRDTGSGTERRVQVAPEIRNGTTSGGSLFLAADQLRSGWSSDGEARGYMYGSRVSVISGLTPGNSYFARTMHRAINSSGANTGAGGANLVSRNILVVPIH
jgi:hypothetical protein